MEAGNQLAPLFFASVRATARPFFSGVVVAVVCAIILGIFKSRPLDGVGLGVIAFSAMASISGASEAAAIRSAQRVRTLSTTSFRLAAFSGLWASFWLIPVNLLLFARNAHFLSLPEIFAGVLVWAAFGFLVSFYPVK